MITCSVCGGLNNPNNTVCEHCGSDLIDETEFISIYDEDSEEFSDSSTDNSSDYIDDYDEYEDDY